MEMAIPDDAGYIKAILFFPDFKEVGGTTVYKITNVLVDDIVLEAIPVDGITANDSDTFPETRPQYLINVEREKVSHISIEGVVFTQDSEQLDKEILRLQKQVNEQKMLLDKSLDIIKKLTG
jgi:hypothetical protein